MVIILVLRSKQKKLKVSLLDLLLNRKDFKGSLFCLKYDVV